MTAPGESFVNGISDRSSILLASIKKPLLYEVMGFLV